MELRQRLTLLRRQSGAPETTEAPPTFHPPDSVEERLQRLRGASAGGTPRPSRDQPIAELLQGERVAEGLIVVDQRIPLSHQHGKGALTPITTLHHPRPPVGQALPAEQLVFLDTETTGLSGGTGTLVFLLGLGRIDGEVLHLRQFFLTGFRGEAALLQEAAAWTAGRPYLVALLPALTEAFSTPVESGADVVAIARYWRAQGDECAALAHLQAHERRLDTTGLLDLALLYKRRRLWEAAVLIWHRLAERQCVPALEHLAKYYEHVRHDYHAALTLTHQLQPLEQSNTAHLQRVR